MALLALGRLKNKVAAGAQLGIGRAHLLDHRLGDLGQKGPLEADQAALVGGAAQDAAQHIRAPAVAGQHTIGDQKSDRAAVVGNGAIGREVSPVVGLIAAQLGDHSANNCHKQVGIIRVRHALNRHRHALKAHAGIDGGPGQGLHRGPLELHKDIVPDLDVSGVLGVDPLRPHLRQIITDIHGDLGARPTGATVTHNPEILCAPEAQNMARVNPLLDP